VITVACVWVHGHLPYDIEYVLRLRSMVARHLSQPHDFVCLTDRPWLLREVPTIPIPRPVGWFGWWSKVHLFDMAMPFATRVLYLDLDTLVVGDLDPIVEFPSPFALVPHAGTFEPPAPFHVCRRFNSSVMVWDTGIGRSRIWDEWSPAVTRYWWGDQDWIGTTYPNADVMPAEWFPRLSAIREGPVPEDARVVLAKKPKPHDAVKEWPWVEAVWRVT
jgi:hypothetical protein